jgi:sarcosine oxidase subunit gamma
MRDFSDEATTRVVRLSPCGMVTLRGDLGDPAFAAALAPVGITVPACREVADAPAGRVIWMSPDELLIQCAAGDDVALARRVSEALSGLHHLAVAVGDARARFAVAGNGARVALAKLCPVDLARFGPGEVRRTRLAQVAAAFWMTGEEEFELVCFRSVGDYVETALTTSARHTEGLALP